MKILSRILAVFSIGAFIFCAAFARAQDWPQWRGANRDARAAGFVAPKSWPQQFNQKWKVTVGQADATPALVGDKLYVFTRQDTDEFILCLNASDGKEVWHNNYTVQAPGAPSGQQHAGPRSSPVVADGKVVTLGVRGTLSCLDASKGTLLWRKDDIQGWPRFFTAMSPLVVNGLCVAQLGPPDNGAIVAYDLATGNEKWKWTGEGPAYASPVLMTVGGTGLIIAETDKSLVALTADDGKAVWKTPFTASGMSYNAATPVVDGQTLIYCGQGRGAKAVKIAKQGDTYAANPVWSNPDLSPQFSTPVLRDGLLFGLTQRGFFVCVDAATGQTDWTDPTGGRGGYGSIVDAGPVLLALTPKSQLIVIQPGDKQYTELASVKVADSATYAYPVVSGNRLFIEDKDSLTLWTIE
jgi:outer membrane protein assembly factor BamB